MSLQLPLSVQLRPQATLDNYYPGRNSEALARLRASARGQASEGAIYLWGAPGCGRTHLLQAACQQVSGLGLAASYLPLKELGQHGPELLDGLEHLALVAVDDVHAIAGRGDWEEGLFHLFNRAFDSGCQLLFSASAPIAELGLALADLSSRLSWGFVFQLRELSDEEKLAALRQRASERGMELPENTARFLLRRCPRDMAALLHTLDRLDTAALMAKRRLTVPFVRQWLEHGDGADLFAG